MKAPQRKSKLARAQLPQVNGLLAKLWANDLELKLSSLPAFQRNLTNHSRAKLNEHSRQKDHETKRRAQFVIAAMEAGCFKQAAKDLSTDKVKVRSTEVKKQFNLYLNKHLLMHPDWFREA